LRCSCEKVTLKANAASLKLSDLNWRGADDLIGKEKLTMTKRVYSLGVAILAVSLFPALALGAEDTLTLPAGSNLNVRLTTTLSTRTNQNGDPWMAQVVEPIISGGEEVVPTGSTVEGQVTYVKSPGRVKGVGEMRLVAESITTTAGARYVISASLEDAQGAEGAKVKGEEGTIKGPSSKKDDAVKTGIGAGVGAGVGAIAAGGTGALYGAGIGAGVGLIRSLFKRGKDVVLPRGTDMTFVISRTTTAKRVTNPDSLTAQ
jgi:type IV secretion system protein VirB10